ncbi:MAG: extracellular solute-binding protein, partial [Candidatus Altiarchaeota archaeon]|nr:extracellular solute-binding protein [Candidatus Altiarchaeota archaeon]
SLIVLKKVDAVMGWDVFSKWTPNATETVYLTPEQVPRISYIPAAVSTYTKDRESAQKFIDFITSEEGQNIFKGYGYLTTEEEARQYAPNATIGGEYQLSDSWKA